MRSRFISIDDTRAISDNTLRYRPQDYGLNLACNDIAFTQRFRTFVMIFLFSLNTDSSSVSINANGPVSMRQAESS